MRHNLELTPRLRTAADLVPAGARLADIGTDHAYLPAALLLEGKIPYAIAADLRHGPLLRAKETAAEYGCRDRMGFRLCDGLKGIRPEETDAIVIAGMGGETIAQILADAPWVRERNVPLVLQPMSSLPDLREWLFQNGYQIEEERLAREEDAIYVVMSVRAGGDGPPHPGGAVGGAAEPGRAAGPLSGGPHPQAGPGHRRTVPGPGGQGRGPEAGAGAGAGRPAGHEKGVGRMATVRDIFTQMDQWAPFETQMDFDNAGFLVGRGEREVRKILVSLDITEPVADEAADWGADLIVAHHPVIFHPVKRLTDETPTGRTLLALAERGIAAICAHTNLDAAQGGVNVCLAQALELTDLEQLHQDGVDRSGQPYGIGRVGKRLCQQQPVCRGVRRLCEGEAPRRRGALCRRREAGAAGGCGGRLLRLHAGRRGSRRVRHLRHRRREIRPVPGGQGPGDHPHGRGALRHGKRGLPQDRPVSVPEVPGHSGKNFSDPPGGLRVRITYKHM